MTNWAPQALADKKGFIKALSEADFDYQDLRALTTESIVKTLTKVSGI